MESFQTADDWSLVLFKSMFNFQCSVKMHKDCGDTFTFQSWVQCFPRHCSFLDLVSALGMEMEGKIWATLLELVEFLAWEPCASDSSPYSWLCSSQSYAVWAFGFVRKSVAQEEKSGWHTSEGSVMSLIISLFDSASFWEMPTKVFLVPLREGFWRWASYFFSLL